jgi:hypothetical protein
MKRALFTTAFAGTAVLVGAVACDNVSSPRSESVSMMFSVPGTGAFSAGEITLQGTTDDEAVVIVRGRQRLRLDVVELNLARIELRRVDLVDDEDTDLDTDTDNDTDTDSDTDTDGRDVDFVRFGGPVSVTLPLRGGSIAPFQTIVPVGTYNRVRFWMESARIVGAFDDDLDGVFEDDEVFNETVSVRQQFTVRLNPPLVVTEGQGTNVTIELQPDWFRNADRSLFNPRRLKNEHQLRARFRHLIRATLRAFEDGNRNGHDDRDTDTDR